MEEKDLKQLLNAVRVEEHRYQVQSESFKSEIQRIEDNRKKDLEKLDSMKTNGEDDSILGWSEESITSLKTQINDRHDKQRQKVEERKTELDEANSKRNVERKKEIAKALNAYRIDLLGKQSQLRAFIRSRISALEPKKAEKLAQINEEKKQLLRAKVELLRQRNQAKASEFPKEVIEEQARRLNEIQRRQADLEMRKESINTSYYDKAIAPAVKRMDDLTVKINRVNEYFGKTSLSTQDAKAIYEQLFGEKTIEAQKQDIPIKKEETIRRASNQQRPPVQRTQVQTPPVEETPPVQRPSVEEKLPNEQDVLLSRNGFWDRVSDIVEEIEQDEDAPVEKQQLDENKTIFEEVSTPEPEDIDPLLSDAIKHIVESGKASVADIQRKFRLGYARASRLIDKIEEMGIISEFYGSKPRNVLMTLEELKEKNIISARDTGTTKPETSALDEQDSDEEPLLPSPGEIFGKKDDSKANSFDWGNFEEVPAEQVTSDITNVLVNPKGINIDGEDIDASYISEYLEKEEDYIKSIIVKNNVPEKTLYDKKILAAIKLKYMESENISQSKISNYLKLIQNPTLENRSKCDVWYDLRKTSWWNRLLGICEWPAKAINDFKEIAYEAKDTYANGKVFAGGITETWWMIKDSLRRSKTKSVEGRKDEKGNDIDDRPGDDLDFQRARRRRTTTLQPLTAEEMVNVLNGYAEIGEAYNEDGTPKGGNENKEISAQEEQLL